MYLYKTSTFPHQPLKSVSKVAFLHRFYCTFLPYCFRSLSKISFLRILLSAHMCQLPSCNSLLTCLILLHSTFCSYVLHCVILCFCSRVSHSFFLISAHVSPYTSFYFLLTSRPHISSFDFLPKRLTHISLFYFFTTSLTHILSFYFLPTSLAHISSHYFLPTSLTHISFLYFLPTDLIHISSFKFILSCLTLIHSTLCSHLTFLHYTLCLRVSYSFILFNAYECSESWGLWLCSFFPRYLHLFFFFQKIGLDISFAHLMRLHDSREMSHPIFQGI